MPSTIVSVVELARTFENEVRVGGVAKRRWACNLSDDTLTAGGPPSAIDILVATAGGSWGAYHPVHTQLRLRKVTVNERFEDDPYKIEVIGEYGLLKADDLQSPTARAAVWSFESQPGEVPALFYYDGANQLPLTNSAYDFFPGLTTDESMVRIKIQKNFSSVPFAWIGAQNYVNSDAFLGCSANTVKVTGVDSQYTIEEYNNSLVTFYATTANLLFRQSSHNLLIPDVGFNFIADGQKRRGMVFDFQNGEWVPSANPVALDGNGGQNLTGNPAILNRRVNPQTAFSSLFGSPP